MADAKALAVTDLAGEVLPAAEPITAKAIDPKTIDPADIDEVATKSLAVFDDYLRFSRRTGEVKGEFEALDERARDDARLRVRTMLSKEHAEVKDLPHDDRLMRGIASTIVSVVNYERAQAKAG